MRSSSGRKYTFNRNALLARLQMPAHLWKVFFSSWHTHMNWWMSTRCRTQGCTQLPHPSLTYLDGRRCERQTKLPASTDTRHSLKHLFGWSFCAVVFWFGFSFVLLLCHHLDRADFLELLERSCLLQVNRARRCIETEGLQKKPVTYWNVGSVLTSYVSRDLPRAVGWNRFRKLLGMLGKWLQQTLCFSPLRLPVDSQ